MAGMSGCLGEEDAEPLPIIDVIQIAEYNHTDSYQFNNYAPMGMGNENFCWFLIKPICLFMWTSI